MPVLVFSHRRDRRFSVNAARFFTIDRTAMYRMMWVFLFFCFLCFIRYGAVAVAIDDDLLDYCIDGKFHKSKPGPEDDLHKQVCAMACLPGCFRDSCWFLHYSARPGRNGRAAPVVQRWKLTEGPCTDSTSTTAPRN